MDCICFAVYGLVTLWMGCALAPTARTTANPNVVMLRIQSLKWLSTPWGLLTGEPYARLVPTGQAVASEVYTALMPFVTRVILICGAHFVFPISHGLLRIR